MGRLSLKFIRGGPLVNFFSYSSRAIELNFWRDAGHVSTMSKYWFLFLDCRESNRALLHAWSKNSYIDKRNFVITHIDKSTKYP